MATETLKIELTGDNKGAVAAIQSTRKTITALTTSTEQTTTKMKEVDVAVAKVGRSVKNVATTFVSLADVAKGSKAALDGLDNSLAEIQKKFDQKWDPIINEANKTAQALGTLQTKVQAFGGGVAKWMGGDAFKQAAGIATQSTATIARGSSQAALALQNIGRVAQDVPFGFMGIQNNLNPLLESFQRLKAETGSSKLAFKALAGSLMGVGGIGLALSVVSSAIVIFQHGIMGFNKKNKEAKDSVKGLADQFTMLRDAMGEANKEAAKQQGDLRALYKTATDANVPMKERINAVKALQKEFPDYFGNISKEKILNGELGNVYNQLTKDIIANAKAKAVKNKIDEVEAKRLDVAIQKQKIINATTNESNRAKTKMVSKNGGTWTSTAEQQRAEIEKRREAALKEQDIQDKRLEAQASFLTKFAGGERAIAKVVSSGVLGSGGSKKEKIDEVTKAVKALGDALQEADKMYAKGLTTTGQFDETKINAFNGALEKLARMDGPAAAAAFDKINESYTAFKNSFQVSAGGKPLGEIVGNLPQIPNILNQMAKPAIKAEGKKMEGNELDLKQKAAEQELYNEKVRMASQLAQNAASAFSSLFSSLQNGENFGKAIGDMFKKIATDIAIAAAKALAFKAILGLLTGGTSVAGGAAAGMATKTGGGFFGMFQKMLGFDGGGVAKGPKSGYPVMLHGTEAVFPMNKLNNLMNNVSMAGITTGMQAGGATANLNLRSSVSANELLLWLERSQTSQNYRR